MAVEASITRLRECGVAGDDGALAALLEAAGYDVNRAANLFLDGHAEYASIASVLASEVETSSRLLNREVQQQLRPADDLHDVAVRPEKVPANKKKGKKGTGDLPAQDRDSSHRQSYAERSQAQQKGGQRSSLYVTTATSGSEELPVGVHYEAGPGESYDVDVLRMQQTHRETGSMRKIRREKKGVWRYDKKGRTWGVYPGFVAVELERIFLSLDRQRASLAQERPSQAAREASDQAPQQLSTDPVGLSLDSLAGAARSLEAASLSAEALEEAGELLLSAAEAGGLAEAVRAGALLEALAARHGLRCHAGHVRRAGLVVGSMRLVQAVLNTSPDLSLVGLDLFDRKYAKVNLQDLGRKNCVRCLLARGMRLGNSNFAPQGKLLRKVEADAAPAWAQRCLDSMMLACPQLPDSIRDRVCAWLGFDLSPCVQSG
mmetsp:Transcript_48557/g.97994  ORF Transcript_48557/g.97994 Transcript_48557/m.97994 type:complete len:432 (+) Transcript_48557:70-1365(+)